MSRIYLAGAESIELFKTLLENDTQDIMLSFFYVQKRGALPQILKLLAQYPHVRIFMDSGAHTFAKKSTVDPQPYWKSYHDFLKQHGHRLEYASEFDIDAYAWKRGSKTLMVDDEQIEVWRDDLQELGTVPIVPVWHESRGLDAWTKLCNDPRYPHLAISRDTLMPTGGVAKLITMRHGGGGSVHGYTSEVLTDMKHLKYDTVSSTTWLVGQKFGDICIFERGNYSRVYAKEGKKKRASLKKYFLSIGVDPAKILADDRKEINKANILAWNALSKRLQLQRGKAPKKTATAPPAVAEPIPQGTRTPLVPEVVQDTLTVDKETEDPVSLQSFAQPFIPKGTPELRCGNCAIGPECPKFNPEAASCAFKEQFALVKTGEVGDVLEELASIFAVNVERGRYMRLAEQLTAGGMISMDLTKHLDITFGQGKALAEMMRGKKKTRTTAQGAGLLDRFFGGLKTVGQPVLIEGEAEHEIPSDDQIEAEMVGENLTDRQRFQQDRNSS